MRASGSGTPSLDPPEVPKEAEDVGKLRASIDELRAVADNAQKAIGSVAGWHYFKLDVVLIKFPLCQMPCPKHLLFQS